MNDIYEKTKAWAKQHPVISTCMLICGGYFFYNLFMSYMFPKHPRIKSNKKETKITAEKIIETPKKALETPPVKENNNNFRSKQEEEFQRANDQINQFFLNNNNSTAPFEELFNQKPYQVTPETPKVNTLPPTTTPSTPTSIDVDIFKLKPVQALCKSEDVNISLATYSGKYLFLIFYPQNLAKKSEITSLNKSLSKFEAFNVSLVGCSNDNKFSHANLNRTLGKDCINFPLIGDDKKEMTTVFNIGLDNTGKNKPTTLVYSPTGEFIKRIDSMSVETLLSEADKLQSNS